MTPSEKENLYRELNYILELLEDHHVRAAQERVENLIYRIQFSKT